MNQTTILIVVAIIIAVTGIAAVVLNEIHTHNLTEFEYPIPCTSYCDEMEQFPSSSYEESQEALHEVLRDCDLRSKATPENPVYLFGSSYRNSTHHIGSTYCEWFPNDEIYEQEIIEDDFEIDYTDDFNY